MDVLTAVITACKENSPLTTSDPETDTLPAAPADMAAEPKATTKSHTAPRKPRVAPTKGKAEKKTTQAKKGAKKPKGAKPAKITEGAREGSKAAKVLDLLEGRTAPHSKS